MPPEEPNGAPQASPSLAAKLRHELAARPKPYIVLVLLVVGGMVLVPEIFPDATRIQGAFGGLLLGVWGTLAAAGGKFFGD